jgi:hypothetical protein
MNMHRRLPKHLHDVDTKARYRVFSAIHIHNEKRKCQPIGNKGSKNQPIGEMDKKLFGMWNVIF